MLGLVNYLLFFFKEMNVELLEIITEKYEYSIFYRLVLQRF